MTNNPFLVDDEGRAAADESLLVEDAVGFDYLSLHIAKQRKCHSYVFGKTLIGGKAVNTDADDLRVGLLEIGDISLIRL